ncbi:hypothetical protein QBC36DRAFT_307230 [Triangularia setosa]|uniref:Uncharacterized protein n=1 Tax=Triangularia setosa TaxID=2587417 RepID=A0AAN7A9M5_9PEZI|nr:hypothetical protein QBC36DRAFT_307230 [Podospora setosa]
MNKSSSQQTASGSFYVCAIHSCRGQIEDFLAKVNNRILPRLSQCKRIAFAIKRGYTTQFEFNKNIADGTLSNAPPSPSLNESSIPVFQLINFTENFEVTFSTSLIENIATDEPSIAIPTEKKEILDILTTVPAVANTTGGPAIEPRDQRLYFTANLTDSSKAEQFVNDTDPDLFVTYFNGQLLPISVPVEDAEWFGENNTQLRFEAEFLFKEDIFVELIIDALTTKDNFTSYGEVMEATIVASGLIKAVNGMLSWDLLSEEDLQEGTSAVWMALGVMKKLVPYRIRPIKQV